jgi:hypothetical protein
VKIISPSGAVGEQTPFLKRLQLGIGFARTIAELAPSFC